MIESASSKIWPFTTHSIDGLSAAPTALPTAVLYVQGASKAVTNPVTVAQSSGALHTASWTFPTMAHNDSGVVLVTYQVDGLTIYEPIFSDICFASAAAGTGGSDPTEANFRAEISDCYTDIQAGSYALARTHLLLAEILLIGLPVDVRHGSSGMRHRESLAAARAAIEHQEALVSRFSDKGRLITFGTGFQHGHYNS